MKYFWQGFWYGISHPWIMSAGYVEDLQAVLAVASEGAVSNE